MISALNPTLPLLNALLVQFEECHRSCFRFDDTLIVGNQHLLPSTFSLIQSILSLGIPAENVILTGKLYSCRGAVVRQLRRQGTTVFAPSSEPILPGQLVARHAETLSSFWQYVLQTVDARKLSRIVLLDDGGYAFQSIPIQIAQTHTVVAIEQTASGLRVPGPFVRNRRINVAGSATKLKIESPIIGDSIARAVLSKLSNIQGPFGIVGLGNVGGAVAAAFLKRGLDVRGFDKKESARAGGIRRINRLEDLCKQCSAIIGCTGDDIFAGAEWLGTLGREIALISASSQDIEFQSVLRMAPRVPVKVGSDLSVTFGNAVFNILYSGFPINFLGDGEFESPDDIQLTRALLLGAVLQAMFCSPREDAHISFNEPEQLNSAVQRYIVRTWFRLVGARSDANVVFESLPWIQSHSGGKVTRCDELDQRFGD